MINLLPQKEKREIRMERIEKKVVFVSIFAGVSFVFFFLSLFALEIYISKKVDSTKEELAEREKELASSQFQEFKEEISETNKLLSEISKFEEDKVYIVPFFEIISKIKPSQVYFTNFSFQKELKELEKGSGNFDIFSEIHISGFSPNRDILFQFLQDLKEEKSFSSVYFTPASWTEPEDFHLEVIWNPKNES